MKLFRLLIIICLPLSVYAKQKICLSDHIFKEFKSYGESLENAVLMAIEENQSSAKIEKHYFDKSPLAPATVYKEMIESSCDGIIGFSYLSDILTISKSFQDIKIPIFSPYGSTYSKKLHENIKLLQPAQDQLAKKIMEFVKTKLKKQKITIVTDLRRIEMIEYKNAFKELADSKSIKISYIDTLSDDIDRKHIQNLSGFIITFTGTNIAAHLIQKTDSDSIFVGVETYGSKTSPSLINLIGKNSNKKIYAFRNLSFSVSSPKMESFYKRYKKKYKTAPSMLSVYGYDSAKILLKMFKQDQSPYIGVSGALYKENQIKKSDKYALVSPSNNYELIESGVLSE